MIDAFNLFLSFLTPSLAGYALVLALFGRRPFPHVVTWALGYGLGMGLLTHWMLLLGWLRLPLLLPLIHLPLVGLALFLILRTKPKLANTSIPPSERKEGALKFWAAKSPGERVLLEVFCVGAVLFILYQLYFIFWNALNVPINSWDAIYFIAKKAKVFFYTQSLDQFKNFPWTFYPIHVTLCETWLALNLGEWNDLLLNLVFPVTLIAFLLIYGYFLYRRTNIFGALAGTVLLLSSNLLTFHSTICYSDLFMLYYTSGAVMLLLLWQEKREDGYLLLASLFAGLGTFVKLEGLSYFGILTLLVAVMLWGQKERARDKFRCLAKFILPGLAIYAFYFSYKFFLHVPSIGRLYYDFTWANLSRIKPILSAIIGNLFLNGNWSIVWFVLLVSILANVPKLKQKPVALLLLIVVLFLGFYFCLALFTSNFNYLAGSQAFISLSRVFLHFFPLAVILIVLLNYKGEAR